MKYICEIVVLVECLRRTHETDSELYFYRGASVEATNMNSISEAIEKMEKEISLEFPGWRVKVYEIG